MRRVRPERFADHYSQARQFFNSQTPVERRHIAEAFTFELSKCGRPEIRMRMLAGLRTVDEGLAAAVADGLGVTTLPEATPAAREPVDLPPSPALSIVANGPQSLAGRKLGVLVAPGADAGLLADLEAAAGEASMTVELVAPTVVGLTLSDGTERTADQKVDGGPSVLYDVVAVLTSKEGAPDLAEEAAARDFVTDAHAHCKFIGYDPSALPLLEATGLDVLRDDGYVELSDTGARQFLQTCRPLRHWERGTVDGSPEGIGGDSTRPSATRAR